MLGKALLLDGFNSASRIWLARVWVAWRSTSSIPADPLNTLSMTKAVAADRTPFSRARMERHNPAQVAATDAATTAGRGANLKTLVVSCASRANVDSPIPQGRSDQGARRAGG